MKKLFFLLPSLVGLTVVCAQRSNYVNIPAGDSMPDIIRKAANVTPSPRQLRWQELELTAFFHFGVNTFTDKEWGDGTEDEHVFNPTKLDARQWVRACKEAGIRQVIITAKHHDGFCLWPSRYTEHSVKNSPWKNGKGDVVRELSDACREQHMGFGIYLSPWDRNSKLYGTDAYNDYFVNQLTELLTNYGRVDEVWFDGANGEGPNGKKQVYAFDRWYQLIRKLQPSATIAVMGPDVRWVGTESGYGRDQEWSVVPVAQQSAEAIAKNSQQAVGFHVDGNVMGEDLGSREKIKNARALAWYPAETDVSIRPGWFYHEKQDSEVKSPVKLLDIYYNSVGKNSLLLLNIPPDREGLLNDADVKNLLGWKALRDAVFKNNLMKQAAWKQMPGAESLQVLTDGRLTTGWSPAEANAEYVLEWNWTKPRDFNLLLLQEEISRGQRVESFVLEGFQDGRWEKITEGTTIGYKRILRFDHRLESRVRLRITSSRLEPHIAEIGVYQTSEK